MKAGSPGPGAQHAATPAVIHRALSTVLVLALAVTAMAIQPASPAPQGTAPAAPIAPPDPAPVPPGEPDPRTQPIPLDRLLPQLRIGARAALIRRNLPVVPVVVIVEDPASYVAAIARWSIDARYPVLIDDGSWQSRQDIARFVRGFRPVSVLRWSGPEGEHWPGEADLRRRIIEQAVARAWGAQEPHDRAALRRRWQELSLTPPGVVVLNEQDPAWTAGLALAAGRGQILAWSPRMMEGGGPDGQMTLAAADQLSELIEEVCERSGYLWRGLGDEIDALTLCLNLPVKIDLGERDQQRMWATTDVIGRSRAGQPQRTTRWAWTGQVIGGESAAAYRAMCALFLQPRNAWLFDGYDNSPPWSTFDATAAAQELRRAGIAAVINDTGAQGVEDFRRRAAGRNRPDESDVEGTTFLGGVRFGLIAVNTSGEPAWFDLRPGRALAGDVPLMAHPGAVYFVHSWSANRPQDRHTIAGRFLEHGAYAYSGSVHEPYLQGFVATPMFARRLAAGAPWGVAGRMDDGHPWKIAVLGDPLWGLGPDPVTLEHDALPLQGARHVHEDMAAALHNRDFDAAIANLVLLARDDDLVRLIRVLLAQQARATGPGGGADGAAADPQAPAVRLSPAAAREALASVYFAGAFDLVTQLYPIAMRDAAAAPEALADILWHTLWPTLQTLRPGEASILRDALRAEPTQMARDAAEVATALERAFGPAAAQSFIAEARARLPSEDARRALSEYLRR